MVKLWVTVIRVEVEGITPDYGKFLHLVMMIFLGLPVIHLLPSAIKVSRKVRPKKFDGLFISLLYVISTEFTFVGYVREAQINGIIA